MKVRVATYKATDEMYLRDGNLGDFSGEPVSTSKVLELGGDVARTTIQNALAELESGKADQIEITRFIDECEDAKFCPICGGKLHEAESSTATAGKALFCDQHGEMKSYVTLPREAP